MAATLGTTLAGLLLLSFVFFILERLIGGARGPWFRKDYWTDTAYWFFAPLITRVISRTVILLPFLLLVAVGAATVEGLRARDTSGSAPSAARPSGCRRSRFCCWRI